MTNAVIDFSLKSSGLCEHLFSSSIKVYDNPAQKGSTEIAKQFASVKSDKERKETFGFRYVIRNGRLSRKKVSGEEKLFKTDGVNSKTSKNKMKIRIGSRPQKYKKPPEPAMCFFNENRQLFLENEVDLDNAVIIDGCFDTNRVILERTAIPEVSNPECTELPNEQNLNQLKKAIKATIRKLQIEVLGSPSFADCLNCKFNKSTKPGFTSEHVLMNKTKEQSGDDSLLAAYEIWNNIEAKVRKVSKQLKKEKENTDKISALVDIFKKYPVPGSSFYEIGARSKREIEYEQDSLASSRAVHMPEFHNEIVMAPWVDGVTRHIKNKRSGPVYIGNSIADFIRYEKDMKRGQMYLEGDWKRFDSTLYARICIVAISILRLFYPLQDLRADAFFLFIIQKLIIKDYYIPGGRVIRMLHGLPSGTKSTNLLGSIINLLCLNFCIQEQNFRKFSFAVGGDDFVIFCKEYLKEDAVEEIKLRSQVLGMEFKFLDMKFKDAEKLSDLPYFYKYTVRNGKPYLKPASVLERVFIPWNKTYSNSLAYLKFLEDQFPQLGYPNCGLLPFYSIYCNMCRRVYKNSNYTVGKIFEMHRNLFEKYSGKIYNKSLNNSNDEIFTFLKFANLGSMTKRARILLGRFSKMESYEIKF